MTERTRRLKIYCASKCAKKESLLAKEGSVTEATKDEEEEIAGEEDDVRAER